MLERRDALWVAFIVVTIVCGLTVIAWASGGIGLNDLTRDRAAPRNYIGR